MLLFGIWVMAYYCINYCQFNIAKWSMFEQGNYKIILHRDEIKANLCIILWLPEPSYAVCLSQVVLYVIASGIWLIVVLSSVNNFRQSVYSQFLSVSSVSRTHLYVHTYYIGTHSIWAIDIGTCSYIHSFKMDETSGW